MDHKIPADLFEKVMNRVARERIRSARRRFVVSSLAAFAVVLTAIPTWNLFQMDAAQSGFGSYLPLLFSDFQSVMTNGQDFALSLIESLPVLDVIALSLVALAFVAAAQSAMRNGQLGFHKPALV